MLQNEPPKGSPSAFIACIIASKAIEESPQYERDIKTRRVVGRAKTARVLGPGLDEGAWWLMNWGANPKLTEPKQIWVRGISNEVYDTVLSRNMRISPLMVVLDSLRET